jgi:hypothetical protein
MTFEDLLREYHIPYLTDGHHHTRPGWIQLDCPFCGKDSGKYHLGYSIEGHYTNCWRCGFHSVLEVLSELTQLSFYQCKNLLKDIDHSKIKKVKTSGILKLPKGLVPLQTAHKKYLKKRGYRWKELVKVWGIQGLDFRSKLGWRIFIPIHFQSKIVSWTSRAISNQPGTLRYLSANAKDESLPHADLLYGEDYALSTIIITEGPLDVWKIGYGAVCTFGIDYSQAQILRMVEYPTRVIWFDNEREAQKRANKLLKDLSAFPGDSFNIKLSKGKDPGEASSEDIEAVKKEFLR